MTETPKQIMAYHDRVILAPVEQKTMLIVPDHYKKAVTTGKVLSTGPKCGTDVKQGDFVIFEEFSGARFPSPHGVVIVLKYDSIIAVVDPSLAGKIKKTKHLTDPNDVI